MDDTGSRGQSGYRCGEVHSVVDLLFLGSCGDAGGLEADFPGRAQSKLALPAVDRGTERP